MCDTAKNSNLNMCIHLSFSWHSHLPIFEWVKMYALKGAAKRNAGTPARTNESTLLYTLALPVVLFPDITENHPEINENQFFLYIYILMQLII